MFIIYNLFNDTFSGSDYTASNARKISDYCIVKGGGGKGQGRGLIYYAQSRLQGIAENQEEPQ